MLCAKSTGLRKNQRTFSVFVLFHGLFWEYSRHFSEFSALLKHFGEKRRLGGGENTLCAHKFMPFVRRRNKKKGPITGQLQGFAAPSTRYGAQSPSVLSRVRL